MAAMTSGQTETSWTVNSLQSKAEWLAIHLEADTGREVSLQDSADSVEWMCFAWANIKLVI